MRAVVLHEHGGPEKLALDEDYPTPRPGPGEILVRVGACSLNYHDIFTRRGMPGIRLPLPVVPGLDLAGEVVAVPDGVSFEEAAAIPAAHPSGHRSRRIVGGRGGGDGLARKPRGLWQGGSEAVTGRRC